jgi:hypothetical protein
MNRRPEKRKPGGNRASETVKALRALYGGKSEATTPSATRKGWQSPNLPQNWRDRLPRPEAYYSHALDKLTRVNGSGYAQARCPFHEDRAASLSVNVTGKGGWKCFAGCGSGDLVSFHMRRTGSDFKAAVLDLLRGAA